MSDDTQSNKDLSDIDKLDEYFKLKGVLKTLKNDVKDHQAQVPEYEELKKLKKKVKELNEDLQDDETLQGLKDKIQTTKERMELIKELLKIEMIDKAQQELKKDGRKLKLVSVLKEMKDDGK